MKPDPFRLEFPPEVKAFFTGALEAVWWDGFFKGWIVGLICGGFAVAVLWMIEKRGRK